MRPFHPCSHRRPCGLSNTRVQKNAEIRSATPYWDAAVCCDENIIRGAVEVVGDAWRSRMILDCVSGDKDDRARVQLRSLETGKVSS